MQAARTFTSTAIAPATRLEGSCPRQYRARSGWRPTIEAEERPATRDGAGEADPLHRLRCLRPRRTACFVRPGESDFREGWEEVGAALEDAVDDAGCPPPAVRARSMPHVTPEFIVRAIWSGLPASRLARGRRRAGAGHRHVAVSGVDAGRPAPISSMSPGVELDPVTARIARLLQPRGTHCHRRLRATASARQLRPRHRQSALFRPRGTLGPGLSRAGLASARLAFIARSIDLCETRRARCLRATSPGTMDKADSPARASTPPSRPT